MSPEHASAQQPWMPGEGMAGRVSVIIPSFDRAGLLVDALDSAAAQGIDDLELVIIDDGSTDRTAEVVSGWKRDHPQVRVIYVHKPNGGAASARNLGLQQATGEFISFLDSDDLLAPQGLVRLIDALNEAAAPYSVGHVRSTDLAGHEIDDGASGRSRMPADRVHSCHWMIHAAVYRREVLAAVGPFSEDLACGEDTELIWRLVSLSGAGILIDEVVGIRRVHDAGHLSATRSADQEQRDTRAVMLTYFAWADRRRIPTVRRHMQVHFLATAIRFGVVGQQADKQQALETCKVLSRPGSLIARLGQLLCRPRPTSRAAHLYYCALWMAYCQGVRVRKLLRSIKAQAADTQIAVTGNS